MSIPAGREHNYGFQRRRQMIDFRSNDLRVELAMDQIYIALPEDPFGSQEENAHVMLDFTTKIAKWLPLWEVSVRIKRPYTYVQITYEGRTACAFGKVNWSDRFSPDTGFAIVARKALAAFYKKEVADD